MAGRWSDEQERYGRDRDQERYDDRYDVFGLNDERDRGYGREDRSFDGQRDRVFGERDSGAEYNPRPGDAAYGRQGYGGQGGAQGGRPAYGQQERGGYGDQSRYGGGYGSGRFDRDDDRTRGAGYDQNDDARRGGAGWQDPDYQGVSPAARRGDYDVGYRAQPTGRSSYGQSSYGQSRQGQPDYGRSAFGPSGGRQAHMSQGYDADGRRFGSRDADQRWEREMRRPSGAAYGDARSRGVYSGGTGGYDYELGYGDAGRDDGRQAREGFEDRARDAGDFFRRAGQKISNWFSDVSGDAGDRQETYRGARGLGPKGYKRSDERISDDVHQRLADDSWLDATNVNVSVSGGEVTLSGTVDSREAKHRAERIVEDLPGVNHVQNNLRIERGGFFTSPGRGYGDSAREAAMAQAPEPVKDVTDGSAATPPAQKRT